MKKLFFSIAFFAFTLLTSIQPASVLAQASCSDQCFDVPLRERQACINECENRSANSSGGLTNPVIGNLGDNPTEAQSGSTFQRYFIVIWQAIINVGGLAVIIMFLWGGVEWITAGGDSAKVGAARNKLTQAVIGLVVLVGSFVIISFIGNTFFGTEFDLLRINLPTF